MLTVRLDKRTTRKLEVLARRRRKSKSDLVRDAVRLYLDDDSLSVEARRQSVLVSKSASEQDALAFVVEAVDLPQEP